MNRQSLIDVTSSFSTKLKEFNQNITRKVDLALKQFSNANSVEEFQQLGILIRDAWVELAQSLYRKEFCPTGATEPSKTDAKRMLRYTLNQAKASDHFQKIVESSYDLCNQLEHHVNATKDMALQCVYLSVSCMVLILDLLSNNALLSNKPYYKCPKCGSLDLDTKGEWIQDIDGAFKVSKLFCTKCGWYYIEEMGGLSGVE